MITPKVREAQRKAATIHGMNERKEYRSWLAIRDRCTKPSCSAYPDYGGRGITMCARWLESPRNFLEDMGPAPADSREYSVERLNNSGNYEPGNCVWATMRQQCRNRRSNVFVTAFGETKILIEWSEDPRCKVNYHNLRQRIVRYGWSPERAMTEHTLTASEAARMSH